jgi:hypothetical protein
MNKHFRCREFRETDAKANGSGTIQCRSPSSQDSRLQAVGRPLASSPKADKAAPQRPALKNASLSRQLYPLHIAAQPAHLILIQLPHHGRHIGFSGYSCSRISARRRSRTAGRAELHFGGPITFYENPFRSTTANCKSGDPAKVDIVRCRPFHAGKWGRFYRAAAHRCIACAGSVWRPPT